MSAVELLSDLQCNGLKWEGEVGLARKGERAQATIKHSV